jgi:hypothetical protein
MSQRYYHRAKSLQRPAGCVSSQLILPVVVPALILFPVAQAYADLDWPGNRAGFACSASQPQEKAEAEDAGQPAAAAPPKPVRAQSQTRSTEIRRGKVEPHPRTSEFNEAQFAKHHTLCVLAFDSVTRHAHFLHNYRELLSDEQIERVKQLVDARSSAYERLKRQRSEILQKASDNIDVATLLKNNQVETLIVSREIHRKIYRQVLNPEQRKAAADAAIRRREIARQLRERLKQSDGPGDPPVGTVASDLKTRTVQDESGKNPTPKKDCP